MNSIVNQWTVQWISGSESENRLFRSNTCRRPNVLQKTAELHACVCMRFSRWKPGDDEFKCHTTAANCHCRCRNVVELNCAQAEGEHLHNLRRNLGLQLAIISSSLRHSYSRSSRRAELSSKRFASVIWITEKSRVFLLSFILFFFGKLRGSREDDESPFLTNDRAKVEKPSVMDTWALWKLRKTRSRILIHAQIGRQRLCQRLSSFSKYGIIFSTSCSFLRSHSNCQASSIMLFVQ